ncbi:monodechloroaminopyrrolnitrin synthase PrnB family protein [Streptomyces agglomeratus]|uniref:monodechloroaminopyrrolnitrin synthase PrnB family protein n=1 Tax=Streptomyces agglomeratus TaxID=285458 RepID=UPI00099F6417|nr:monodechloroaminopyrrolnitrin synthase PrnB family protein [Streptomyces agglomeratus]
MTTHLTHLTHLTHFPHPRTAVGLVAPGLDALNEPRYRIPEIRQADPLAADPLLAVLPAMNRDADVPALTVALRTLLPLPAAADEWSVVESLAAMRDLGMFLGSLKRHGTEPLDAVPEALPVLETLGRRTDMVPRDTVHHYTTWNPIGLRRRTYTGEAMEADLQDAVRMVFPSLAASLDTCAALARLEPHDPGFAVSLDRTAQHVQSMVDSIDFTVANVSPVFFARTLRPYFEEIDVAGRDYLGPAAAQVPLWLIDLTLWQCDHSSPEYDEFLAESVPYSLPSWRDFHAAHTGGASAVSKLAAAVDWENADRLSPQLAASAVSLARVLRILKTFRARHIGIARKAYSDDLRLYEVGSGGAPIELLRSVLDLTRDNETLVRRATGRSRTPVASHA